MNIAIIPARGGSKRIPRKNIKTFAGKPMIAHAIEAAQKCGLFEHIIVSTDDEEIASIGREWGAETPFFRPEELSNDQATTVPVIAHGIQACSELGWIAKYVCCIYPAVPFIQISDLKESLAFLIQQNVDYCFPVTEFPSPIQRAMRRLAGGKMQPIYPAHEFTRTQDLETAYHDAGQFYWGTSNAWCTNPGIHGSGVGLPIPSWRVVDIDTPSDWDRAEVLFQVNATVII